MTLILNRLVIVIEQHHGRDLPHECLENELNINRHDILSKVFSSRHASELNGPTFAHIIDSKEVDALISDLQKHQPPLNVSKNFSLDLRANATPFKNQNTINQKRVNCNPYTGTKYETQSLNSLLHRYNNVVVSRAQTLDTDTCKQSTPSSGPIFELSRSPHPPSRLISPQCKSHPPFRENDEWQAYRHFVDQKVMELSELFNQAVENIKHDAQERLNLHISNELDEKYHVHTEFSDNMKINADSVVEKYPTKELKFGIDEYTTKPQVVSVLRLLTALEDYLGSLGPKIVELLSKALQAEKNNPTKLDSLILTTENCNLLETAMQKFKGIIITGILGDAEQNVLRKAVDEVRDLLSHKNPSHYPKIL